jgi:type IV pilus assembly protein PilB
LNDAALQKHLVSSGLLDPDTLEQVLQFARSRRRNVAESVLELGLLAEPELYKAVAKAHGMSFVDPGGRKIAASLTERIPAELALENRALPVVQKGDVLYIAIDDPDRVFVLDNLAFVAGCELKAALAPPSSLESALSSAYGGAAMPTREEEAAATAASVGDDADAPIIRLVHKVIETALERRASDIHIEPFENDVRVRYRIDGVLHETGRHPKNLQAALTSRIKLMAGMDIAEKRKPQDGRIQMKLLGRDIDLRVSALPAYHGESIVMRILDKEMGLVSLEALGFHPSDNDRFQRMIKRPSGIFLVTGPTGSGKTTTLYAALKELNRPDVKIITAEDPVEYHIPGINQCQVLRQVGLDFPRILRSMLRQAPNIILVGEIRDLETAEIAIQAALTGHLVFSTLHTNDAPSALTRLIDMGVKPFLVSTAVSAVMAQRLVRRLCDKCKTPYEPEDSELRAVGLDRETIGSRPVYRPVGCEECGDEGYRGRKGIFELFEMDNALRELAFSNAPTIEFRNQAMASGMLTLQQDGVRKVLAGETSIDEVLAVTHSGDVVTAK